MRFASAILLLGVFLAGCGRSEKPFPNQAITIVCPWNSGGGSDRLSRFMADQLQAKLGQPVVVVNKTGGSGAIGFAAGANAPADGYTITMATFELSTMHWLGISRLTHENFAPLVQLNGDAAAIIVRKDSPFTSLTNLVDHIRANPGKLKMSGTAKGAAWDLARSGFLMAVGLPVQSVVWVPTEGAAPSIVALLGNHIDAISCSVPEALTQIEAGELRVLAVMSAERLPEFPQFPTCKELGIQWEAVGYRGLALPRGTPEPIVTKLADASLEIAKSDAFKAFMKKNGFAAVVRGPAEFREFLKAQDEQWHKVILGSNLGLDSLQSNSSGSDPGPWALPIASAAFVVLASAIGLFQRRPAREKADSDHRKLLLPLAALATYTVAMPLIGFFVVTTIFATLVTRYLGKSWLTAVLSSLVLMFTIYLLFVRLFKASLPHGVLF